MFLYSDSNQTIGSIFLNSRCFPMVLFSHESNSRITNVLQRCAIIHVNYSHAHRPSCPSAYQPSCKSAIMSLSRTHTQPIFRPSGVYTMMPIIHYSYHHPLFQSAIMLINYHVHVNHAIMTVSSHA